MLQARIYVSLITLLNSTQGAQATYNGARVIGNGVAVAGEGAFNGVRAVGRFVGGLLGN